MAQADIIIRIAAATLALVLAAGLWRDGRDKRIAFFFSLFALGVTGFLAGNTPDDALKLPGTVGNVLSLLSGYNAIFLWWFVLAVFDDDFRPGLLEGSVGVLWVVIATANRDFLELDVEALPLNEFLQIMILGILAHIFWRLWKDWEGDLEPARRNARGLLAFSLAALLAADVTIDFVMGTEWKPQALTLTYNLVSLFTLTWLFSLLSRFEASPLQFRQAVPSVHEPPGAEATWLAIAIGKLMTEDQAYLDPDLSFGDFVDRSGASEPDVRRYINHELGFRHFRAFLNSYRVDEARRRLSNPEHATDKIIAIAFDSGFSSLASFHRAFRATTGETPGAFRVRTAGERRENLSFET